MNKINKFLLTTACLTFTYTTAFGEEISTNTAVMQAMDKITGQVDLIEIPVNQEVGFGTFSILVRECKTRSPEETPENFAFVDVVDNTISHGSINIFKGWMLSSSPALNPVAHPIYDVWLIKCIDRKVNTKKQMSAEQLTARDQIEMNRQTAPAIKETPYELSSAIENNGEPTNLIPSDIEQKVSKAATTAEGPILPEINNINQHIDSNYEIPEEGEPEALIDIPDEQPTPVAPSVQPADYENFSYSEQVPSTSVENQHDTISRLERELSEKVNN